ncbi:hypothetical protein LJK88_28420 [Paenibacillus sp. P26]|nr:hypothetical protein LJK88_28420 [Paenibacillus sp. P26]UUZ94749.1 hypothetical protein LJK87_09605 [Paenibacillus sp. P25]
MSIEETKEIQRIVKKLGSNEVLTLLSEGSPLSDLSTLLLEVFRQRTRTASAAELLRRYRANRFVHPAGTHPLELKRLELTLLEMAESASYTPIQLSPVAPLGSCSIVGPVDQNNVISALRGTEVVADATNLLALHICDSIQRGTPNSREELIRYCTTHRHVRAQFYDHPGLLPHFHLFCMVVSGKDTGSYAFEKQAVLEHIALYQSIFQTLFQTKITVSFNSRSGYTDSEGLAVRVIEYIQEKLPEVSVIRNEHTDKADNRYYQGLQFSIIVTIGGEELMIGDGGFVDWSKALLGNKKERMMISAFGLDRLVAAWTKLP